MQSQMLIVLTDGLYPFNLSHQQLIPQDFQKQGAKHNDHESSRNEKQAGEPLTVTFSPPSVKVRQTIRINSKSKFQMLSKAYFLKNLKSRWLVKLQNILEERNADDESQQFHLMYEHIDVSLKQYLSKIKATRNHQSTVENIYEQIGKLAMFLSNIGVKSDLAIDRIGFTEETMQIKFFMGLDFQWDQDGEEEKLLLAYKEDMEAISSQLYQQNKNKQVSESQQSTNHIEHNHNTSVSIPLTIPQSHKNRRSDSQPTQKQLSRYKPEKNQQFDVQSDRYLKPRNLSENKIKIRKFSYKVNSSPSYLQPEKFRNTRSFRESQKKQKLANKLSALMSYCRSIRKTTDNSQPNPKQPGQTSFSKINKVCNQDMPAIPETNQSKSTPKAMKEQLSVVGLQQEKIEHLDSNSKNKSKRSKQQKYHEYLAPSLNGKTEHQPVYVKDFIQVLEANTSSHLNCESQQQAMKTAEPSMINSHNKSIVSMLENDKGIQDKAKQAISNSLKVIQKFRQSHE